MTFYTPQQALDYLRRQVSSLFAARGTLQDAYGKAVLLRQKSMGTANAVRASQFVTDLIASLDDQTTLERRIRSVVPESWVPQTVGIVPLIIGAGGIAIAGAVYLHLQRVAAHRETLALVEKGVLTPAQAIQLESSGGLLGGGGVSGILGNASSLVLLGIGAYALFLFGPMLSRMVGGRKS